MQTETLAVIDSILARRDALTVAYNLPDDNGRDYVDEVNRACDAIWDAASQESVDLLMFFADGCSNVDWMNLPPMPAWFEHVEGNPEFYADLLTMLAIAELPDII